MSASCSAEIQETLETSAEWELTQRVAASPSFSRSHKLKQFLLYVCERSITGRTDEITEQQIGVHVFGRPSDYNPGESSIVRSQARLLRHKLETYFANEGSHESLEIVVTKGTYIPCFRSRTRRDVEVNSTEFQVKTAKPNQHWKLFDAVAEAGERYPRKWQVATFVFLAAFLSVVILVTWSRYSYLWRPFILFGVQCSMGIAIH